MTEARPRLVLIDGYAVAYRSYFATKESLVSGRAFRTTKGEPTNAVHGFAGQLLDIMKGKEPPQYLAVVFDAGLSNRDTAHVEYKTNRVEMDPEMDVQIPRIRQLVEAFNIPLLELEGYEADDVIGTIAHQADTLGVHVHIVTVDSDLLQLVNDNVTVQQLIPMGDAKFYDTEAVVARFGVRPDQIRDYKALVGDSSDNYPGVAGIGKGTAPKLLQQYETIENLYLHIEEIKGSQKDKLIAGHANAVLGKQLATIITDLPIHVDLAKCATHDYDVAKVDELFQELEFNSIRKRIGLTGSDPAPTPATKRAAKATSAGQLSLFANEEAAAAHEAAPVHVVNTVVVNNQETLAELLQALANATAISFDTETDSLDQIRTNLVGISLAVNGETGYYIPVGHKEVDGVTPEQLPLDRVVEALRPAMTDPTKEKYAHNAAFDLIILRRHGIDVKPITMDTMVGEWLNRPDSWRKGLKDQAWLRLGVRMTEIDELIGKGKNQITMAQVAVERAAPYAAADAAITFRLVEPVCADLEANNLLHLFKTLEMPLLPILADMQMAGALLDIEFLAELSKEFVERLNEKAEQIYQAVDEPFNIGSLKQLNEIFFQKLKLPTKGLKTSQHGYSLDADALETLKEHHIAPALLLDWRSLEKLRSTYVDAMPKMVDEKNRIHTTYNQTGAVTGRISSEGPNLQNIPVRTEEGRRVRRAFIAPEGRHLLSADYSQIELRILAHYSEDPFLIDAFEHDQDIHKATAAAVASIPFDQVTKEQRYFAKRVNFGLLYGMGAHRLVRESELSYADAKTFIDQYFTRLSGVKLYLDSMKDKARAQGYLETMLGRRRDFSLLRDDHPSVRQHDRARMEREAINTPIQGTAADIIKLAMLNLSARLKQEHPRSFLILQVHDELVLEVPDDEIEAVGKLVIEEMQSAVELKVPLKAEANVGKNWAEMTPMAEWLAKVRV